MYINLVYINRQDKLASPSPMAKFASDKASFCDIVSILWKKKMLRLARVLKRILHFMCSEFIVIVTVVVVAVVRHF